MQAFDACECFLALSLEQVYRAITYYLAHREEVDSYLKQAETEFDTLRERTHGAALQLSRKLAIAREQLATAQP